MAKNLLATKQIKHAKPGKHSDGEGLMLVVGNKPNKQGEYPRKWVLRIQFKGKRHDIGLGGARARVDMVRAAADRLRDIAKNGEDPVAAWKAQKAEQIVIPTFEAAARQVHAEHTKSWRNQKHVKQWISTLQSYMFPAIGDTSVAEVEGVQIRDAISEIWLTKPETARRTLQRACKVLDFSHSKGWRDTEAPLRSIRAGLPKQPRQDNHFEALDWRDIPDFFVELDNMKASEPVRLLLEFTILAAARSGESREMAWAELNLEKGLWEIPAERMNGKRPHNVPLSDRCLEILERAKEFRETTADSQLVFEGRQRGRPFSNMTITATLRNAGYQVTVHGMRSSFRDWCEEATSYPTRLAEKALAHVVRDKTEKAYARGALLEKRRELMASWSNYCLTKRIGSDNIATLHPKAG